MADASEQVQQGWQKVVAAVKDGPMNLPLWEALEQCVGLSIIDGTLYIGMEISEMHRAPVIKAPQASAQVTSAVQKVFGDRLTIEIIEGTDATAIEREQARIDARSARDKQVQQRLADRRAEGDAATWDSLSRNLHQSFAKMTEKGLPWKVVEYMRDMLGQIAKVEAERRAKGDEERDINRGLARMLSALASQVDAPPLWVASEYMAIKEKAE